MSAGEPLHLRVDVDRGSAPISGEVQLDGVAPRSFAGWTELFVAFEGALADAQEPADQGDERDSYRSSKPTGGPAQGIDIDRDPAR